MKIALDEGAKMPTRGHPWDGGLDLYSRDFRYIKANGTWTFDTGVHAEIPEGYVGPIRTRSSMMREGIYTVGTIDAHYTGSIKVKLENHGIHRYSVQAGDRIAQRVIVPGLLPKLELVDHLGKTDRGSGGFGSTGR
mgnify:CR=1 FL=1